MLFSIIIPVYNTEKYLHQCVDSVLAQDFKDYEIILVDDGSPDNSNKICDEYAYKFPHIQVIHKENGGLSDARNAGLKIATGDYLMFLDSDDFWKGENILCDLSSIINKVNPDVITHDLATFYDNDSRYNSECSKKDLGLSSDFVEHYETLVKNLLYEPTGCNKIFRRKLVADNKIEFQKGVLHEDVAWCYDMAQHIKTYAIYESTFYQYRLGRDGAITNKISDKNIISLIEICYNKTKLMLKQKETPYFKGNLQYLTIAHLAIYRNYYNKLPIKCRANVDKHFFKMREIEGIYKPYFVDYVKGKVFKSLINKFGINRGIKLMELYTNLFYKKNSFKF